MRKKIIKTAALVCMTTLLAGSSAFATSSKMAVLPGGSGGYSASAEASCSGDYGTYEFKPNTGKTLTGRIREYNSASFVQDIVASKKYSALSTGSFYQKANYSYKVYLTKGTGYGVVTVQ